MQPTTDEITLFSEPRLRIAYNNNMEYYYANIYESAEISKILQVFEVALRNYIDNKLKIKYGEFWIFNNIDFSSLEWVVDEVDKYQKNEKKKYPKDTVVVTTCDKLSKICQEINVLINKKEDRKDRAEVKCNVYDKIEDVLSKHGVEFINKLIDNSIKIDRYSLINSIIFDDTEKDKISTITKIINVILYGKSNPENSNKLVFDKNNVENLYNEIYIIIMSSKKQAERYYKIWRLFDDNDIKNIRDIIISRLNFGFWVNFNLVIADKIDIKKKDKVESKSFYDVIEIGVENSKNKLIQNELRKVVKLRNRCSHEERIIDIQKDMNGNIYYAWTQDTKEAIDAIRSVGLELFQIDIVSFCASKIKNNYNIQR